MVPVTDEELLLLDLHAEALKASLERLIRWL
jgi:hypothetical protein